MNEIRRMRPGVWTILAVAFLAGLPTAAEAAPRVTWPWLRDMQVTIYARRALMEDPALARLNLGVNVRDGIATLWGPIPDNDAGRQAVKCVEKVKGVLQVRTDLYILGPRKEEEMPDLPFVFDPPTKTESASPDRDSGQITNLTGLVNPGFPAEPPPAVGLQTAVALLPPVALAETPQTPVAAPASVSTPGQDAIASAIERLRKGDERFRAIGSELKYGTVLLRSGTARGEDVMAFALAISQVTGVERVVVQNGP